MFRKPKKKEQHQHLRKQKRAENGEEEAAEAAADEREELEDVESRIHDVLEAQKVRRRRNGMDAVECAVGREMAREFQRLDENPFQMRGGGMLQLTDHQKAALNAADIEADIKEQFKAETLLRDEHEEMRRYVEARMEARTKQECPSASSSGTETREQQPDSKRPKFVSQDDEILFKAAERVKSYASKRNEELLSNQMLVGIPEVDLGIETRMKNIEQTEQKKVELMKKGIIPQPANSWLPLVEQQEGSGEGKKRKI